MQICETITEIRQAIDAQRSSHRSIGLVPTMGALHQGHLTLIDACRTDHERQAPDAQPGLTVCSIFVNPTQFNNPDDLARYPRTLEADYQMLEAAGCELVFAPSADEMYPTPPRLNLSFGELETVMEGASRPGHFNGVGLVVSKLFHIVQPHRAYFGQKDLQQVAVVKQLIRDLSFQLELVRVPTVREPDGLAMSSRNRNLTPTERQQAPELYRALTQAAELLRQDYPVATVKKMVEEQFRLANAFRLDYFEIANADTLQPVEQMQAPGMTALCVAAYLGHVRLIDNLVL